MSNEAPPPDVVTLLPSTARALDEYVCPVGTVNANLEAMAWLWFVLRETPDTEGRFPRGKWATVQAVERQLIEAAKHTVRTVEPQS